MYGPHARYVILNNLDKVYADTTVHPTQDAAERAMAHYDTPVTLYALVPVSKLVVSKRVDKVEALKSPWNPYGTRL